jgi:hypothetical protein
MTNQQTMWKLAKKYLPILKFHPDEKYVPINVEYWLSHLLTKENQTKYSMDPASSMGTQIHRMDTTDPNNWKTTPPIIPQGKISLSTRSPAHYIGNSSLIMEDSHFIHFSGDKHYNFSLFSPDGVYKKSFDPLLGKTSSSSRPEPTVPIPPRPNIQQSSLGIGVREIPLTRFEVYAEIIKVEDLIPFESDESIKSILKPFLAVNYYYFYPMMIDDHTPSNQTGVYAPSKFHEGQWECISLLFRPEEMNNWDEESLTPLAVIYSESWVVVDRFRMEALATPALWERVKLDKNQPIVLIGLGTHENLSSLTSTLRSGKRYHVGGGYAPSQKTVGDLKGAATIFFNLGWFCVLGGLPGSIKGEPVSLTLLFIGLALLILGAILYLFSLLVQQMVPPPQNVPPSKANPNRYPRDTNVSTEGIQVGGTPAANSPPHTKYGDDSHSSWSLRVINMFNGDHLPSDTYPPQAETAEKPSWWNYAGEWGTFGGETAGDPNYGMGSGTRRTTAPNSPLTRNYQGSRAWHNIEALMDRSAQDKEFFSAIFSS